MNKRVSATTGCWLALKNMKDIICARRNEAINSYTELCQRHQQEVRELPIAFAFDKEQFQKMMERWGLDPEKDLDKIFRFEGTYRFFRKQDASSVLGTFKRHEEERAAAIAADRTGDGFIYQMFYFELAAHEYGYTGEYDDTLEALGYTWEQVEKDSRLRHGLEKAAKKIDKEAIQWL